VKSLLITITASLLLAGAAVFLGLVYLFGMPPGEIIHTARNEGKFLLYRYELVDKLTPNEVKQLYQSTCTRKCHSSDIIEKVRTAAEWQKVINRMKAPDRADLKDREAKAIVRYLEIHFLSNIPTVLPEKTMKFARRYLWKSDFGESDLFLDVIYIPRAHIDLLPYFVASNDPPEKQGAVFVVYLNTHQGTIPPWNLAKMAKLTPSEGPDQKAIGWTPLYRDTQSHHIQGLLYFPDLDEKNATMAVTIHLPGMRERIFQWALPIPAMPE